MYIILAQYETPFVIRHARKKETGLAKKYATLASGIYIYTYNVHRYMYVQYPRTISL